MRYVIDHDLHNHSLVSPCSRDARQTKEAIFSYALTNRYKLVGITDHLWPDTRDAIWDSLKDLPQSSVCRCLAGAEVDMDMNGNLLLREEELSNVDFFILALTHVHLLGCVTDPDMAPLSVEATAAYIKERLYRTFTLDLPFERVGLAHITCVPLPEGHSIAEYLSLFSDEEWEHIFTMAAKRGMGVELNFRPEDYDAATLQAVLHPYRMAKQAGCRFYLGGDAHHPEGFGGNLKKFERIVDLLALTENDKWELVRQYSARLPGEGR